MAYTLSDLQAEYAADWAAMKIVPDDIGEFQTIAKRIEANIGRYKAVEKATGVPASIIAVLHEREADGDFKAYLGDGEPLDRVTVGVPQGRGPFPSFEAGAIDALHIDGLDQVKSWSIEQACFSIEDYNGWGYRQYHNEPSPYLWAGTNIQQPGKYVADGKFNRTAYDTQLGCMPLLYTLWQLDPTLRLSLASVPVTDAPKPQPVPIPPRQPDDPGVEPKPVPAPQIPVGSLAAIIAAAVAAALLLGQHIVSFIQHLFGGG